MNFKNASAKLYIGSVEGDVPGWGTVNCVAQYNPKELQVDHPVPWSKHSYTNKGNDLASNGKGAIYLEFTGAEGRSLTVELLFDGYEEGRSVAFQVAALEALADVKDPTSDDDNMRRPPLCVVVWGDGGLPSFTCVVESLSTKYVMFSESGMPLRAICTVTLKEADKLGTNEGGGSGPDAGAGAAGGA